MSHILFNCYKFNVDYVYCGFHKNNQNALILSHNPMILFLFSLLSPSLSFSLLNANASSACMMNINRKKQAAIISFGMPAKTIHPNQTHILYDEFQKERRKKNEPRTTPKFIVSWLLRDIASSLSFIHLFSFFFRCVQTNVSFVWKAQKKKISLFF